MTMSTSSSAQPRSLFFLRVAFIFTIGYVIILFSPFGKSQNLQEFEERVLNALWSGNYPDGDRRIDTEPASVVMMSDATLAIFRSTVEEGRESGSGSAAGAFPIQGDPGRWPVPYAVHDYLLAEIIKMRPAAIMVDVLFERVREWDDTRREFGSRIAAAQRVVNVLEDRDVPLYFATVDGTISEESALRLLADGRSLTRPESMPPYVKTTPVAWGVRESWYPARIMSRDQSPRITPAFQIYRDLCLRWGQIDDIPAELDRACGAVSPSAMAQQETALTRDMLMRWPAGRAPGQQKFSETIDCPRHPATWYQKAGHLWDTAVRLMLDGVRNVDSEPIQACPPIVRIDASWFLPDRHLNRSQILDLIKDRVVFYGAYIEEVPDIVPSPVHGMVAGVEYHATAYHNLVTLSDDYYHRNLLVTRGWEAVLWLVISFFAAKRVGLRDALSNTTGEDEKAAHASSGSIEQYIRWDECFGVLVTFVVVLGLAGALFWFAMIGLPPIDILTIISLVGLMHLVETLVPRNGKLCILCKFSAFWRCLLAREPTEAAEAEEALADGKEDKTRHQKESDS